MKIGQKVKRVDMGWNGTITNIEKDQIIVVWSDAHSILNNYPIYYNILDLDKYIDIKTPLFDENIKDLLS